MAFETSPHASRTSPYTVYAGVAADDLSSDNQELRVNSPDLTPDVIGGGIGAGITKSITTLKDRDGNTISAQTNTANHVVATWEGSSNSTVPPMVRRGEPVEVFRRSNQDKWYWRATGRGSAFRTTDRIYMHVAATDPTKPGEERTDDNSYHLYADSDKGLIGFKSSAVNGEACRFTGEVNTKSGTFVISDDSTSPGNRIVLKSGVGGDAPFCQINLSSGITLKLEGDNFYLDVPGSININAKNRILFNSPIIAIGITAATDIIINGASVAINSAKDVVLNATRAIGINAVATKVGGAFVMGQARVAALFKGSAGSDYTPATLSDPISGSVSEPSNSPDTTMTVPANI